MKAIVPLFLGILNMVGCSVGKPALGEVEAIEAVTARSACVGSLDRWHREFAFQQRGFYVDRRIIYVAYTQAGHRNLPAGRFRTEPGFRTVIDDTRHRFAGGDYDRKAHGFTTWVCG